MPRSSRRPAKSARPAARSAPAPSRPAPPQTRPQAAPPATQSAGGGMLSGMASTMAQGFAFGTGSAVAHRAVGAVAGSFGGGGSEAPAQPQEVEQYQAPTNPCEVDKQNFSYCLQQNNNDVSSCQFVFEALQTCQMESKKAYN